MPPPTRKGFGTTLLTSEIGGADAAPKIAHDSKAVPYSLEALLPAIAKGPTGREE